MLEAVCANSLLKPIYAMKGSFTISIKIILSTTLILVKLNAYKSSSNETIAPKCSTM